MSLNASVFVISYIQKRVNPSSLVFALEQVHLTLAADYFSYNQVQPGNRAAGTRLCRLPPAQRAEQRDHEV